MSTNRSDALVITADDTRHIYEPRSDGRYDYIEKARMATGEWREVGHDIVETLAVENAAGDDR